MKRVYVILSAVAIFAGISNSVATRAMTANALIFTINGTVIRPLWEKGTTWDCEDSRPEICFKYESVPESNNFDLTSLTLGYAFLFEE